MSFPFKQQATPESSSLLVFHQSPQVPNLQSFEPVIFKMSENSCPILKEAFPSNVDQIIKELATKYRHDWKKISKRVFSLTKNFYSPSVLQNRFHRVSKASDNCTLKKCFSQEEDIKLISLVEKFYYKWEMIASNFPNRDYISLKNRYYYLRRRGHLDQADHERKNQEFNVFSGIMKITGKRTTLAKESQTDLKMLVDDIKLIEEPECLRVIKNLLEMHY